MAIPHPPTCATEQEAQSAAQATESLLPTLQYFCFKGHTSSFTHPALQVPSTLPVPGPDHRGFLLQELGTGNSKRDSSLGTGLPFSTLWKAPLRCTGILHSASPRLFRANNTAEPRGYFSTFFLYISIKRILICMFVVCSEERKRALCKTASPGQRMGESPCPQGGS